MCDGSEIELMEFYAFRLIFTAKIIWETAVPFKRNSKSAVLLERNNNAKKTQNFNYFSFIKKLNSNEIKKY